MIRQWLVALALLFASAIGVAAFADVPNLAVTVNVTTGNLAATMKLTPGQSNCAVQITGTWTATLSFTVSNDGTNYFAPPNTSPTSATSNGLYFVSCASVSYIQVSTSSITGTAVVAIGATGAGTSGAVGAVTIPTPLNVFFQTPVAVVPPSNAPVSCPTPSGIQCWVNTPSPVKTGTLTGSVSTEAYPCTYATPIENLGSTPVAIKTSPATLCSLVASVGATSIPEFVEVYDTGSASPNPSTTPMVVLQAQPVSLNFYPVPYAGLTAVNGLWVLCFTSYLGATPCGASANVLMVGYR